MDVGISWANESCGFSKIGSNTDTVTHSVDVTVAEANRLLGTWEGILEYEVAMIQKGDVNHDGMITEDDVPVLKAYQLGNYDEIPNLTDELKSHIALYGDINGDGTIRTNEIVMLNNIILGACIPSAVNAVQPVETVLLGDANGDGAVAVDDATTISRTVRNMDYNICTTNAQLVAADVNQDGVVSDADADTIEKYIASAQNEEQYPNINKPVTVGSSIPTVKYVSMISFTVDGTESTVEEGKTW